MKKELKNYIYEERQDYNKKIKINRQKVGFYSCKKMDDLYPKNDYKIIGETLNNRRLHKDDIGEIELANKLLYVAKDGSINKIFRRTVGYIATTSGEYIKLLKRRFIVIILFVGMLLGLIGCSIYYVKQEHLKPVDPVEPIEPIEDDLVSIYGFVNKGEDKVSGATVSLYIGDKLLNSFTTSQTGKYIFADVKNSTYSIVCEYGKSLLTGSVTVNNETVEFNFDFPNIGNGSVQSLVKKTNDAMPVLVVKGLDKEACEMAIENKDLTLALLATKLSEDTVDKDEKKSIEALSGDLELSYFDISILKETYYNSTLEDSYYLNKINNILEIAISFDSSKSNETYVFRNHEGQAEKFTKLDTRPTDDYKDGTYYVTKNAIYIYTSKFCTYAVGVTNTDNTIKGEDTFTYNRVVYVSKSTGNIDLLYKRDSSSTNLSKVEIYLSGNNQDYLIGRSKNIKSGYELKQIKVNEELTNLPDVGVYKGYMLLAYLDASGEKVLTNAKVEISVVIKD